jgi:hypothetical protein
MYIYPSCLHRQESLEPLEEENSQAAFVAKQGGDKPKFVSRRILLVSGASHSPSLN